jgi:hypothetical protein
MKTRKGVTTWENLDQVRGRLLMKWGMVKVRWGLLYHECARFEGLTTIIGVNANWSDIVGLW